MKLISCFLLLVCAACLGQLPLYPTTVFDKAEFLFTSVANSKEELSEADFKNFRIVDTIPKPYSLLLVSAGTLSIAISKESGKFDVYEIFARRSQDFPPSTKFPEPTSVCSDYVQVSEVSTLQLDKTGTREMTLKFLHSKSCCPTCAIPLNPQCDEGLIIFDFDKLQKLELVTRSKPIMYGSDDKPVEDVKVRFKRNHLQVGRKKYVYQNDKLIQK